MKATFFASLLLLAVGATANPVNIEARSDQTDFLNGHNNFRANFPVGALTWSTQLASSAQNWANGCKFQHSGGNYGENIAAGAGGGYNIASAIASWTNEEKDYNYSNPQPSHFSQVVWKGTTQVGCAKAMCDGIFDPVYGKALYVVCQYSPPGNVIGQFPANVPHRK